METKAIFANRFTNKVITNIQISGNETATKESSDPKDDYKIDLIVNKALSFRGIEEIGNNKSFNNEVFKGLIEEAGWESGLEWCAYFAKMVFTNALPSYKKCFSRVLVGNSQKLFKNAKAQFCPHLKAFTSGPIKRGDILVFQNLGEKNKDFGHIGIVSKLMDNGYDKITGVQGFTSIEGNAKYDPSQKGGEEVVGYVPHIIKIGEISSYYTEKRLIGVVRFRVKPWFGSDDVLDDLSNDVKSFYANEIEDRLKRLKKKLPDMPKLNMNSIPLP